MPATSSDNAAGGFRERFVAWLVEPRLPARLAIVAALLAAPSLAIGFHLDDHVHRYLFSGLPGSAELWRAYESPFGIANGEPEVNHWQIERGYAPWWTAPDLLISLYRPISELTHRVDAWLWSDAAVLQHAHSLAWFAALAFAAAVFYRGILGAGTVGGLAALFYAIDHTHGFAVGWIANRNALVSAVFAVLALWAHDRARAGPSLRHAFAAPALLLCALLAGEGAIAIAGYLVAHAWFVDRGTIARRVASLVPHGVVIAVWRIAYGLAGRGSHGSGLYVDPVHEPLRFLAAVVERAPALWLGQVALPPAEVFALAPAGLAQILWGVAVVVAAIVALVAAPVVRADRTARFWAFGAVTALVPACTTHPNNRLLFLVGLGFFGLLAQLWHAVIEGRVWAVGSGVAACLARAGVAMFAGFHLIVSPVLLPLSACAIALTSSVERSAQALLDVPDVSERDLVLVAAPDYFYVKLLPVLAGMRHHAPPPRLRALSFGAVDVTLTRTDLRTLVIDYPGGILADPLLELYRARALPMPVGTRVELDRLVITVLATTSDGRPNRVRFVFEDDLDAPRMRWMSWRDTAFVPFSVPRVGERTALPAARVPFGA